jgi:hypothetical protein
MIVKTILESSSTGYELPFGFKSDVRDSVLRVYFSAPNLIEGDTKRDVVVAGSTSVHSKVDIRWQMLRLATVLFAHECMETLGIDPHKGPGLLIDGEITGSLAWLETLDLSPV